MMAFIASSLGNSAPGRLLRHDWQTRNWTISALTAVVAHGLLVIGLLPHLESAMADAGSPVVMVDFAPQATAPAEQPSDLPKGPQQLAPQQEEQAAREATPQERVTDLNSIAKTWQPEKPDVTLPEKTEDPLPAPLPVETALPAVEATPPPTAAPTAAITAERAAGPAPGDDGERAAKALATWQLALVTHLERFKRYPREARPAEGVANVAFTLDRAGKVVTSRIVKSSGSAVLDAAALDLIQRAQPMPAPPPETVDAQLSQVAPVRYVTVVRK